MMRRQQGRRELSRSRRTSGEPLSLALLARLVAFLELSSHVFWHFVKLLPQLLLHVLSLLAAADAASRAFLAAAAAWAGVAPAGAAAGEGPVSAAHAVLQDVWSEMHCVTLRVCVWVHREAQAVGSVIGLFPSSWWPPRRALRSGSTFSREEQRTLPPKGTSKSRPSSRSAAAGRCPEPARGVPAGAPGATSTSEPAAAAASSRAASRAARPAALRPQSPRRCQGPADGRVARARGRKERYR
ncbi:unnamed protein product [Prorocentrum cordatum]|nr:unnamed protein product [Polarella glacialis]